MEAIQRAKETTVVDLGALLDDGDDTVVSLVAGNTRLVAHRAVLMDRSPVFATMFAHNTLEASSGQVTIVDVEGPVLRQLLSYLYTLRTPQLPADIAPKLLAAADKYGVASLKAACEQQVATQLSVETAAAAAVLAVRHSCTDLKKAATTFIKSNLQVMATQGWTDAILNQPKDVVEVSRLLADPAAENSMPVPADSGTSQQPATQPHNNDSRHSGTPASAALATATSHHAPPPDNAAVSRLRSLPPEERNWKLRVAAGKGAVGQLEALLAAGADVADRSWNGCTALHSAAVVGQVEAARRLVARGAPLDARCDRQRTPLHLAAEWGHAAVARLLLDASADRSARDQCGKTPLDLAKERNHQQVVELLSGR